MTLDRILPNYFLKENKRGSSYRIIITFLILCLSLMLATKGRLESLASVYTFSFLAVMVLFGIGNLLLKIKRRKLPRPEKAKGIAVVVAIAFIIIGFAGNSTLDKAAFYTLINYLVPAVLFVLIMLNRSLLIKTMVDILEYFYRPVRKCAIISNCYLRKVQNKIHSQEFVFFTKGDDVAILNKVMQYVQNNETTRKLKILNVRVDECNDALKKDLEVLDRAYPEIHIDFVEIDAVFGPELIDALSQQWNIPKNFMFIASPGDKFFHRVSELGGVRLIMLRFCKFLGTKNP